MTIPAALRRRPTQHSNKKGTFYKMPFKMVVQIGLEPLTSCKYPHVCADCGAKNALCGLE